MVAYSSPLTFVLLPPLGTTRNSEFPYPVRHLWRSTAISWCSNNKMKTETNTLTETNLGKWMVGNIVSFFDGFLDTCYLSFRKLVSYTLTKITMNSSTNWTKDFLSTTTNFFGVFASSLFFGGCLPILFPRFLPLELDFKLDHFHFRHFQGENSKSLKQPAQGGPY